MSLNYNSYTVFLEVCFCNSVISLMLWITSAEVVTTEYKINDHTVFQRFCHFVVANPNILAFQNCLFIALVTVVVLRRHEKTRKQRNVDYSLLHIMQEQEQDRFKGLRCKMRQ